MGSDTQLSFHTLPLSWNLCKINNCPVLRCGLEGVKISSSCHCKVHMTKQLRSSMDRCLKYTLQQLLCQMPKAPLKNHIANPIHRYMNAWLKNTLYVCTEKKYLLLRMIPHLRSVYYKFNVCDTVSYLPHEPLCWNLFEIHI